MSNAELKASRRGRKRVEVDVEERAQLATAAAAYDSQLVHRMRHDDESAFAEIVGRYRDKMFSVAFSLLRDRHDGEEIVQDTFVRAHRGIARFRGDCSLVTWLHRITLNLARNRYWFFHRRARHSSFSLDRALGEYSSATLADSFSGDSPSPSREAEPTQFVEVVRTCMDKLLPFHRDILTMRSVLNQSYEEIARSLGIREGTVKSRIARARGCLLTLMAEACPDFAEGAETKIGWKCASRLRFAPTLGLPGPPELGTPASSSFPKPHADKRGARG
jgi:RNA polymerase sigma-70 factor, ECF subfamily